MSIISDNMVPQTFAIVRTKRECDVGINVGTLHNALQKVTHFQYVGIKKWWSLALYNSYSLPFRSVHKS